MLRELLLYLLVEGVLAKSWVVLHQLKLSLYAFAIFARPIADFLALRALQFYKMVLGHISRFMWGNYTLASSHRQLPLVDRKVRLNARNNDNLTPC